MKVVLADGHNQGGAAAPPYHIKMSANPNVIHMPRDLRQLPQFQKLKGLVLGEFSATSPPAPLPHCSNGGEGCLRTTTIKLGTEKALAVWWEIYVQLAYQAEEGHSETGLLSQEEAENMQARLVRDLNLPENFPLLEKLVEPVKLLTVVDGGYMCSRFVDLNGIRHERSREQRGADMRSFSLNAKKAETKAVQTALALNPVKFVDEEGKPLEGDMPKQVTRLIFLCDSALFKQGRENHQFTEALIANAVKVIRDIPKEGIEGALVTIARNRENPILRGMTTERLLPEFQHYVGQLK